MKQCDQRDHPVVLAMIYTILKPDLFHQKPSNLLAQI